MRNIGNISTILGKLVQGRQPPHRVGIKEPAGYVFKKLQIVIILRKTVYNVVGCFDKFGIGNKIQFVYFVDKLNRSYTERVERLKLGKTPTKLLTDIANYVQKHLTEPVNIEALSKAVFVSRTHLAVKFKKETGMTLTEFVLKEKIEEGKRLLRYTDKSLSAIATYLGFSSQSHFSNVFRKYAGCLPSEYRLKHIH